MRGQRRRPGGRSRTQGYGSGNGLAPGKRTRTQRLAPPRSGRDSDANGPAVAPIEDFLRESVIPTLSMEIPELRARADEWVKRPTNWATFKNLVINSHEWDDPIRRAVFVRYFSELQRTYWSEGQAPNQADVIDDVVGVELNFWARRNDVDLSVPATDEASPDESGLGLDDLPRPQSLGSGIIMFMDSEKRLAYAKLIKQSAEKAEVLVELAEEAGDLARAESAARTAHGYRNDLRAATQEKVSPGARLMSKYLEKDRSWERMLKDKRVPNDGFATLGEVAKSSGRSNSAVLTLAKVGRVAGPFLAALTTAESINTVANAPSEDRVELTFEEVGAAAGGALGSVIGSVAMTAAAGALLGSNPVGWVVIGASIAGSALGVFGGSAAGRAAGGAAHGVLEQAVDAVDDYVREGLPKHEVESPAFWQELRSGFGIPW